MPLFETRDGDALVVSRKVLVAWGLGLPLLAALLGFACWHSWNDHELLHAIPGVLQQQQQKVGEIEGLRTQVSELRKQLDALPQAVIGLLIFCALALLLDACDKRA